MKKILVIGEILVEIMADTEGEGFRDPQPLTGPFPSGAPAIFASQASKLGQPVAMISAVGDDDFGRINLDRLKQDGVDISGIRIDPERPTGSAFVRYRHDGSRDFVFNIHHSACGQVQMSKQVDSLIDSADHIHIMGSSLSGSGFVSLNLAAAKSIKAKGGTVSFDPNLRKEMLSAPGLAQAMNDILKMTDLFLPSGDELMLLTDATNIQGAVDELFALGISAVVHKKGADGAVYYDSHNIINASSFAVEERDPTGAGDSFGGTFTAHWLRGTPPREALKYATAAGALAVTKRGPMEGVCDQHRIESFLSESEMALT
jgi:sugar/nucleoside kinase (ribokinase family)